MIPGARSAEYVLPRQPDFQEEIWEILDPFLFPPRAFKSARKEIAAVLKRTGLKDGRVLDLACGPGRHSVALAKNGLRVTGVDRSHYLLDKARRYALCGGVSVEFIQQDMRIFSRPDSYDLVLSLYSSFGYFEEHAENRQVLDRTYENLKKGGMIFMDLPGREVLAGRFKNTVRKRVRNLGQITEFRTIYPGWEKLGLTWKFYLNGQLRSYSFKLWLYSGSRIKEMLAEAGFSHIRLYGSYEMGPYDDSARQLIVLAVKS